MAQTMFVVHSFEAKSGVGVQLPKDEHVWVALLSIKNDVWVCSMSKFIFQLGSTRFNVSSFEAKNRVLEFDYP